MPRPRPKESKSQFMKRCMHHKHLKAEFNSIDKRVGKCLGLWASKKKK